MTHRAGLSVTLAGLVTAVLCGVPALLLVTTFGWGNLFFTVDDLVVTLLVLGSLGLVAVAVGLVISGSGGERPGGLATACSLACLAAIAPSLLLWLLIAVNMTWEFMPEVAGPLGVRGGTIGACALSLLGSVLGLAALRSGVRGAAALALNALVFLGTGVALLAIFGPLR